MIIGQHGGNFSIALHNQTVDHQLKIADKFVSWGWDKDMEDHVVKLPSLQLAETPCITPDFQGQVLHILTSLPRYFYCHYSVPVASQFLSYLQDQLDFFDRLESTVIEKLNIRPDLNQSARGWNVKRVIENRFHRERERYRKPGWWGNKTWHRKTPLEKQRDEKVPMDPPRSA